MRIIDNSSIYEPRVGTLIKEGCSVGQFVDNCIYIIADEESSLAKIAESSMNKFDDEVRRFEPVHYNKYDLEVVNRVELKSHPLLKKRIKDGDNFVIQLSNYVDAEKKFIVGKTDEESFSNDIYLIVSSVERITHHEIGKVLKSFATDNTNEFVGLVRNATQDCRFESVVLSKFAERDKVSSYSIKSTCYQSVMHPKEKEVISYQLQREMFSRFLDNLQTFRKNPDPKVAAELDFVIKVIDAATWRNLFVSQSPQLQKRVSNYIDPQRMAQESKIDLEVRHIGRIDPNKRNDGRYRLFLVRGDEALQVHFSRKNGCILYLIYLLDRKKNGDNVDTLNLKQQRWLFDELFKAVYGKSGEKQFDSMMKDYNAYAEKQQKGIYTVLKSIRDDVGSTCERMQEPADPFILSSISSHLAVLPEHIKLPAEFMTIS